MSDERKRSGYCPPPPADEPFECWGPVKWPWFSARRRGHLLEQRVADLERRLKWTEQQLVEQWREQRKNADPGPPPDLRGVSRTHG